MHPALRELRSYGKALLNLLYTPACPGCGAALLRNEGILCITCQIALPVNPFFGSSQSEVHEVFAGRLPLVAADSLLFFSKGGIAQSLIHALKYQDRQDIGEYLGRMMGEKLRHEGITPEVVLPVPLHPSKQKARGYNQCHSIGRGIASVLGATLELEAIERTVANPSQTKLNRAKRWDNVKNIFELKRPEVLTNKHVLLIDDTLTTGATLESCGSTIIEANARALSIATLAYAK